MNRLPIQDIFDDLSLSLDGVNKTIHLINGPSGIGKSRCVDQLLSKVKESSKADGILIISENSNIVHLPEFISLCSILKKGDKNNYDNYPLDEKDTEAFFNNNQFNDLANEIKNGDPELFEKFYSLTKSKSFGEKILYDLQNIVETDLSEIMNFVSTKGDWRLLLQTDNVISESLIVDLLSIFFPIDDMNPKDLKSQLPAEPLKIIIAFDDIENCSANVLSWLFNSFFYYAYDKQFSEFISYSMAKAENRIRVSQFFDFRFVISTQERISEKIKYIKYKDYLDRIKHYNIEKLEESNIKEILNEKNIKIDTSIEYLNSISYGIPGLMLLWTEFFILDDVGDDASIVYNKAANQILNHRTNIEREWLRCTSFLDEFDSYGLRCFPEMNENYDLAFEYFKQSNELTRPSNKDGFLLLKEEIIEIISRSISSKSEKMYSEYTEIANVYNQAKSIYFGLSKKNIEVLRNLAYFKVFDLNEILQQAFDKDFKLAKKFIKDNPEYFRENKYTFSLNEEIRGKLIAFNKRIDLAKFKEKQDFIDSICDCYADKLREKIISNDDLMQKLNREKSDLNVNVAPIKNINENLQRQYIDNENKRIDLKKKLNNVNFKSNIFTGLINLGLSVSSFLIALFIEDLYEGMGIEGKSDVVQTILFGISGVLFVVFAIYIINSFSKKLNKNDKAKIIQKLKSIEKERKDQYKEMKGLRQKKEKMQSRINEIEKQLEALRSENSLLRDTLTEDFSQL